MCGRGCVYAWASLCVRVCASLGEGVGVSRCGSMGAWVGVRVCSRVGVSVGVHTFGVRVSVRVGAWARWRGSVNVWVWVCFLNFF